MTRFSRSYFFTSTPAKDRFLNGDKPPQSMFAKLFGSIPFVNDSADKAKTDEQGLVQIVSDADANILTPPPVPFVAAVQPHQIPQLIADSGITVTTKYRNVSTNAIEDTPPTDPYHEVKVVKSASGLLYSDGSLGQNEKSYTIPADSLADNDIIRVEFTGRLELWDEIVTKSTANWLVTYTAGDTTRPSYITGGPLNSVNDGIIQFKYIVEITKITDTAIVYLNVVTSLQWLNLSTGTSATMVYGEIQPAIVDGVANTVIVTGAVSNGSVSPVWDENKIWTFSVEKLSA